MITKDQWDQLTNTLEKALGKGCVKYTPIQNCAFVYAKDQKKASAIIRFEEDGTSIVHFNLSLKPGIAAFIACLIFSHIDFTISEHFCIDEKGKFLNEDEAIEYLSKKKYVFDNEIEKLAIEEAKEDIDLLNEIKKKDLLN